MSLNENGAGTILHQPTQSRGSRRLPLSQTSESSVQQLDAEVAEEGINLREVFAEELALLAQETKAQALAEARKQAERELAAAHESLRSELNASFDSKLQQQQHSLDTQRLQLVGVMEALHAEHERLALTLEPVIGRLSLAVVLRLLGRHAAEHSLVADLARHAIDEYQLASPLRIQVSEADYRAIVAGNENPELLAMLHISREAKAGSCLISFALGELDASLDTQFASLKAALLNTGGEHVATL